MKVRGLLALFFKHAAEETVVAIYEAPDTMGSATMSAKIYATFSATGNPDTMVGTQHPPVLVDAGGGHYRKFTGPFRPGD